MKEPVGDPLLIATDKNTYRVGERVTLAITSTGRRAKSAGSATPADRIDHLLDLRILLVDCGAGPKQRPFFGTTDPARRERGTQRVGPWRSRTRTESATTGRRAVGDTSL